MRCSNSRPMSPRWEDYPWVPAPRNAQRNIPLAQVDLEEEVSRVCRKGDVDGVLVQLPLPQHLDEGAVMERLDPAKDVDGFHPLNMGSVCE